ncbi:MAG: leucine--tRNA ligase [Planctomycetota bacterium]|nr:leucine--tRNA ligase [Planctomycetota bacterium]
MPRYNPAEIEKKWQSHWDEQKTFQAPEMPGEEKAYILDMFPYPSGNGLHVGHPEGYTATDILCRYWRMLGKSVLHPMGFDAFGLPAEEHAIKTNTPPRQSTEKNIDTFRGQLKRLGFSYDWDREIATTEVDYFKWTQWIFLVLHDTWFDHQAQKGRPISELPIPDSVRSEGEKAVRSYQDEFRLAFLDDALVNWCPALGTVLANEEVIDGKSERGGHPVQRMPLRQWMLRITDYAQRLESDLANVNWPEGIKKLQTDWIGKSSGAEVDFYVGPETEFNSWQDSRSSAEEKFPRKASEEVLRIYTTRPDTLFGATYMVIAPEHPLVESLTTAEQKSAVEAYCAAAAGKSDRDRQDDKKEKTGVFSGSCAINPVNGERVPVWIADYVLISYGTGAIMAVPAHDERDFEFASQYGIPIVAVVDPIDSKDPSVDREKVLAGQQFFGKPGKVIRSGPYDGMSTREAKARIIEDLAASGCGREAINFKLRDWLFSRQRFWGEPFPILHELDDEGNPTGLMRPVDVDELPVDLPPLENYKPHGRPEPPLAKADDEWLYPVINGKRYRRETNTMPQWAGSCWYYLRFIDPKNGDQFVDPVKEKAWMPVDLYVGGAEHAVLHLLYARFWHKVLFDRGHVSTPEPFNRLVNQGMILGEYEYFAARDAEGNWVPPNRFKIRAVADQTFARDSQTDEPLEVVAFGKEDVEKVGGQFVSKSDPNALIKPTAEKMSKARGNVINPDTIVEHYGADTLRLYEMFMGPLEQMKPWNMDSVGGIKNFLNRLWRMIVDDNADQMVLNPAVSDAEPTDEQLRFLHKTIKAISQDTEKLGFNTAIARMMEFVNFFTTEDIRPRSVMEPFVLLIAPYAPHIAEELWRALGKDQSLAYEPWPPFDESLTRDASIEIPVQIKGKIKTRIQVPAGTDREELESLARQDETMQSLLAEAEIIKVIAVPDRMVNFVVR